MATLGTNATLFAGSFLSYINDNDSWTFNGTSWAQVSGTIAPSTRSNHAIATLGGNLILFGGFMENSAAGGSLSDTWSWNGARWSQVSGAAPSGRGGHSMASFDGGVVLFGGCDSSSSFGDTWM